MAIEFSIREATADDAAELLNYLKQIGSETHNLTFGSEGVPFSVEEERRFLESMQTAVRSRMYLAFSSEGEIIGNATFQGFERKRMRHRSNIAISVKKKYWGLGIGSGLMKHMIDFAKSIDVEVITLEVLSENQRAISLYEKFNFIKFGTLENFFKLDDKYYAADFMMLQLKSG